MAASEDRFATAKANAEDPSARSRLIDFVCWDRGMNVEEFFGGEADGESFVG